MAIETIKFSEMTDGGDLANNDKTPGLQSGANVLFNNPWTFLPPGTTAERPAPSSAINFRLRFNTTDQLYEYYDAVQGAWTQLQESLFTQGPFITYTASASLPDAQNLGLLADGILHQTIAAGVATLDILQIPLTGAYGGTGVNNSTRTITIGGNFEMSGAFNFIGRVTGDTDVTFPTSGTLITSTDASGHVSAGTVNELAWYAATGDTVSGLPTANGGTLVTDNTGVPSILAGSGVTGNYLQSVNLGTPIWSLIKWPDTLALYDFMYCGSTNVVNVLTAQGSSVMSSTQTGAPVWVGPLADGQIVIGSSSLVPVAANITQGSGLVVTNGPGSITVALNTAAVPALTMAGNIDMANTYKVINAINPTNPQDYATKFYVDQNALSGTSVYAASAASLGTVTQSGSGVGATLTNAGAQATFALDGVNPPVGVDVLIKNTATGMTAANEGIYTVTNAGSGATNWVLTRSTEYDTPEQINNTGLIVVQNGTTLGGTAWYNADTIVTVDTTPFNFTQFGGGTLQVVTQVFPSSGTYTPTPGMVACITEAVGGGGGGGGVANCAASNFRLGAGGGYGGYGRKTYTASEIGASATVTIGALGAGGANTGANGGTGGTTTFDPAGSGATLTANGGVGGTFDTIDRTTLGWGGGESPGAGGTASNGDINIQGQYGQLTIVVGLTNIVNLITGVGGSGIYGAGGRQNVDGTRDGRGGTGYGAGGSGAATVNAAGAGTGGDGTAGVVIVTEFVFS